MPKVLDDMMYHFLTCNITGDVNYHLTTWNVTKLQNNIDDLMETMESDNE